jgi:hypothetical protein
MDVLDKLFGSAAKVKIMRMFLYNPGESYDTRQISDKLKITSASVRREIGTLEKIGFVRARFTAVQTKKRSKKKAKRVSGWALEPKFPYIPLLQKFLIDSNLIRHRDILRKLNGCGRIKLVVLAGVFINDPESRVDMLIVGDSLKKGQIENVVRTIESQIGKEIKYASFETNDFNYRLSMCDKLIRDILDFSHETIIDKVGLTEKRTTRFVASDF